MLAQNFKTAEDLGITDREQAALVKVLGMFERREVPERLFVMATVGEPECGTPGCILGWARTIEKTVFSTKWPPSTRDLFIRPSKLQLIRATTDHAASALRNYLTLGEPRWAEVLRHAG